MMKGSGRGRAKYEMTVRLANASHFELNDNGEHQLNENTVTVLEKQGRLASSEQCLSVMPVILINFVATPSKNVLRQITALLVVILKWSAATQRLAEPVWRVSDGVQHPPHISTGTIVPGISSSTASAVTVGARFLNSWHRSLSAGCAAATCATGSTA
uniref:Uncharacterized protein n=1 Tax=Anopheles maculatus TaxID=74869 RepID=A0A182SGZ9_9DIPT